MTDPDIQAQIDQWHRHVLEAILVWEAAGVPVSGVSSERAQVFRVCFGPEASPEIPPPHPVTGETVYNGAYRIRGGQPA